MKTFEDHGQALSSEDGLLAKNPNDLFHVHPHYELMVCTTPLELQTIICSQHRISEYPIAVLTAPFVPHFISAIRNDESGRFPRAVLYFGSQVWARTGFPHPPEDFLENGAARIFDLSACFSTVRMMEKLYPQLREQWQRERLLGMLLGTFWEHRSHSTVMMNLTDDYILQVINYVTGHLEERMTIDSLARRFFVSQDKLKKDFKRSTYTNIGDFIQYMRLNRAKELLSARPRLAIGEVIRACGYESESYFFRMFKKATGKTPLQFQSG